MSELLTGVDGDTAAPPSGAAARMRAAREAAGLSLKDIAETTRVPLRHLASLEEGDYSALPGATYVSGFARAYARAVGMDESALVSQLREEIDEMGGLAHSAYEFEEAVNPARIPPRWLAWVAALIVLVVAASYGIWRMQLMTPPTDEQIASQAAETEQGSRQGTVSPAAPAPAPAIGPVVMTAVDDVWIRIYQPDGTKLYEGILKRGDSYTVPDNARDPMILTGRPDALAVTVGGQAIPPLGSAERTISDVPVGAAALLARPRQPVPAEDNAAAPAAGNASGPLDASPPSARPAARRTVRAPEAARPAISPASDGTAPTP